jgi:hypothetical protein
MFSNEQMWQIVTWLGLANDDLSIASLELKLRDIGTSRPEVTMQVQADLGLLISLDASLQKNLGLVKADIIQFDAKLRAMGFITRMIQLVRRIARSLAVEPDISALQEMYGGLTGGHNNDPLTINKVRG